MGVASSSDETSGVASPSILSKVSVKGGKADMDAFMTEGRVDNVQIGYVTKKQHERFNPRNINRRVVLTHSTIKRVKRNWAMISEDPDAKVGGLNSSETPLVILYDTFFGRLFMLEPSMRAMFEDNMIRQSKFLVGLVNIIVKMEDMLKQDLTPVYSFADHSVAMGARPEHYEIIASVLPFALESCAEERAWNNSVAEAWKDVMSFAILAVVERTVESWLSRGTSLSEMWHTLSDWRIHSKNLASPSSSTRSLPTPERLRVTRNPLATRPSLGPNSSGGLPEAPPRLLHRGAPPDPLQAGRPPGATESLSFSNADTKYSGLTAAATADDGNINIGSPRCDEDGGAAGRLSHHPWARRISTLTTSTSTATAALSTAQYADQDLDVACNLNSCVLSDGEPDGLSSNNSVDVDVDVDGGAFGSGTGARKGSLKNAIAGVLHVSGGGEGCLVEGSGSRSRSPPSPQQRKETKLSPSELSHYGVGRSATDGSASFARSIASIRRPESASLDPSMALDDASRTTDTQERRLSNRSVSVDVDHEEYHHLGAIVTGASAAAASRAAVAAKGTVIEGAGAGGRGVIGGGAGGVSGGHRSSLNILRRKKITRSASLEEDDEISHRRHSVLSRASQDLKGGRGGGSNTRASQDLAQVKENGGMIRGKGRDGSLALTAGYVRSQSVTDELLPADRHDSSRFDRSMTRFDLGGDLPSHLDQHTRRRGLVSRMRRTASNVIRFRSSSRPLESSCEHGREHGLGQSNHTANAQHATHRQNNHGGIGLGVGIGRQTTHQQVRVRSYASDMIVGADGLRVSSASPASTAVPTPAAATPPVDSTGSHRAPRDDRCHYGVSRMAGSVEHAWTVSHGNQGYKKPFSPPPPLPGQALARGRTSQSGPVLTGLGGFGGEKTAFAYYFSLSESEQEAHRSARQHQQEQHQHQQQRRQQQHQQQRHHQQQQRHQQQEQHQQQQQRHQQQQQRHQQQEQQQRHQQQGQQQDMRKDMKQGCGEGDRVDGGNGGSQRPSSGTSVSTGRDRTTERDNPWRQMKLHELMAKLEDSSAGETERNFGDIAEAILWHLGPSEPPTTRALALDVAQTFVQNVLSERSKDRKSSKIRRKAFKEFLLHVVPLVLDCLKCPGRNHLSSRSAENGSATKGASEGTLGEIEPASLPAASAVAAAAAAGVASAVASRSTGTATGTGKAGGDVVVLHYYQQHHQYVLRVTALETMSRFLTVLRALFRPPHSTRVQKAVAPLLDAEEEVLRERAAAVLGKLSLCGKASLKWANVAIKVSLEAHNFLHDAWPDESAGQIPSSEVESIMEEHPLLPAIHDTFAKGDPEAHVMALGRRFPALCKLLATLVTVSPPRSNDANMPAEDGVQMKPNEGGESSAAPSPPPPYQIPFLAELSISLVQRVLRMGEQARAILEDERTGLRRDDSSTPDGTTLVKSSAQHHRGDGTGTLTPELAARVSGVLLPSVVNLLDALVTSPKLERVMEEHQAVVCRCMAQAVAQMPVQGGMRFAAYRSMALVIRYTQPGCAALELGVPMLPLLFNEALLALGNTVSLYRVSHKTVSSVRATEELSGISPGCGSTPEVAFNVRTPVNNGHGVKLHHDTVWAGVECLAELVLISGHFLPPAQIAEVERVVTEGVELLATRPLEVSPFNEDEPQVLRHASTREAFVKLVHFYLVLAEEKGRNPGSTLYSEAKVAFLCHLQDPDGAVARECGRALTALKAEGIDQNGHHDHGDHHDSRRGEDGNVDRRKPHKPNEPHKERPLEDMEAEADKGHHASNAEAGYVLEELDTGEYHVVRCADKVAKKQSPARVPKAVL